MKAVALSVSARKGGNFYDFARFVLGRLAVNSVKTKLVNFYDYLITPASAATTNVCSIAIGIFSKRAGVFPRGLL